MVSSEASRILIVDDDRTTCLVLRRAMEQNGHRVCIASNGAQAIRACEETEQDLILLDYVLPDINGAEVCAAIRRQLHHSSIPILVVTSRNDDTSVKCALAAGASDFITKPFLVPVLRQRVHHLLAARNAERLMRHLAYHDSLTGLPNRAYFNERLDELVSQSIAVPSVKHAVLYLDLDRFKMVNDTCGHSAGDELLRQLSTLLQGTLRQEDMLARLGGDEFGALLVDCSAADAWLVAAKLRDAVSQFRFSWQGKTLTVGVSIGIAMLEGPVELIGGVLAAADNACYAAKNAGSNLVHMSTPALNTFARRRIDKDWTERIHAALADHRFTLDSQPIVPVSELHVNPPHIEMVLQLAGDTGTLVPRDVFLRHIERFGMSPHIDRWVVTNAAEHLHRMNTAARTETTGWIPVSAASMADPAFAGFVVEQLERFGLPAGALCFQICETALLGNMQHTREFINYMSERGALFAVDDFSAGLASFRSLPLFSIQFLKINGAWLKDASRSPVDHALVKAISDVAHTAGVRTVVKQLDNVLTVDQLRSAGVDFLQGPAISSLEL